MPEQLLESER